MCDRISTHKKRVFPVYLGSHSLSPFHGCYSNSDSILRFAVGRTFLHDNGEDEAIAYWALRRDAALFDVPERPVEICGRDAVPFLERLCTRRFANLATGRGRYALMCTHDGGLFMDGIVLRLAEDKFWFVQPDGELDAWLLAHRNEYAVRISDPSSRVLQLQGPKSLAILRDLSEGAIDHTLPYFGCGFFTLGGQEILVSRTGWTGELGYEIYTSGPATDCPRLWSDLLRCGEPHGLVFGAMRSMNIRRIEAGILDSGSDFDVTLSPWDVGLDRFVDGTNETFIGREAVLAAPRGNRLFGLRTPRLTLAAGDRVYSGGKKVAHVTTGARSPHFGAAIGYARFDSTGDWVGQHLVVRSPHGEESPCEILSLPFYDKAKRLPREFPPLPETRKTPRKGQIAEVKDPADRERHHHLTRL